MDTDLEIRVNSLISETISTLKEDILHGSYSSFDQYQRAVGFFEGVQFVYDTIKEAKRQIDEEENLNDR